MLLERGRVSPMTSSVIGQCASVVSREQLKPGDEFWSAKKTLINLVESSYFRAPVAAPASARSSSASASPDAGPRMQFEWPSVLKRMLSSSTSAYQYYTVLTV